ncbi:polymorphic toxin-type HINT domain-containing protein [Nocardiopsis sp. CC223A]|uniref:polymorphic toxin-type HINT domain-containing protein n=1 Tax=Nocardiopsis sp. CC223A TaxID=3044051 RepID=UPI0027962028|nr:polymorphic toxin-type HINT domain-containing protein [Nocardiopsis sp. CC223A]
MVIATDEHPFWVPDLKAWVDAVDLAPGMCLQTSAGTWVQINAVQAWSQSATVHNLTVQGVHTYHVATGSLDVLNHNCGGEPPEELLDFADEALNTNAAQRPNVATMAISEVNGEIVKVRAYAQDSRIGSMPSETANAVGLSGHHGGCGEANCAAQLERVESPLRGAVFYSVRIGGNKFSMGEHLTDIGPCPACRSFLQLIGGIG